MTAELAVALPAVVLVLAACLGAVRVGVQRVVLQDDAALVACAVARDGADAIGLLGAGTSVSVEHRDDGVVCATVRQTVAPLDLPLAATSCALGAAP